jgi:peptidoglycan/LPS O-acetylase OafA/YrhL
MDSFTKYQAHVQLQGQKNTRWLSHNDYLSRQHIAELDGLRSIAVALVITCHLHEKMWGFLHGQFGVTIFFVLSGYLITRLMLGEEFKTGHINIPNFYIRRTFRIFPLYFFVLGIYTLLILGFRSWPDKVLEFHHSLPYLVTYFQEIPFWRHVGAAPPFYQSWSLGIEEKFYICFPVLMIAVTRSERNARLVVVALCISGSALYEVFFSVRSIYHTKDYGSILLGVLVAMLLSNATFYRAFIGLAGLLSSLAFVVALIAQFHIAPYSKPPYGEMSYAVAAAVLIGCFASSQGLAYGVLSWRPFVFIGKLSYGIYLVHILCLNLVEHFAKPGRGRGVGILAYAGTLSVSTGVAYLLHLSLEVPMIRLGRYLSRRAFPPKHQTDPASAYSLEDRHNITDSITPRASA